jgi:hypothetical protein
VRRPQVHNTHHSKPHVVSFPFGRNHVAQLGLRAMHRRDALLAKSVAAGGNGRVSGRRRPLPRMASPHVFVAVADVFEDEYVTTYFVLRRVDRVLNARGASLLGFAKHIQFSPRGPGGSKIAELFQITAWESLLCDARGLPGSPRNLRGPRGAGWSGASSSPKSPKVFIPYASEGPAPTSGVGTSIWGFGGIGGCSGASSSGALRSHGGERLKSSVSLMILTTLSRSSSVSTSAMITAPEGQSVCPSRVLSSIPGALARAAAAAASPSRPGHQQHRYSPIETLSGYALSTRTKQRSAGPAKARGECHLTLSGALFPKKPDAACGATSEHLVPFWLPPSAGKIRSKAKVVEYHR